MNGLQLFISSTLKFFFILTPFFVLSMFTSVTRGWLLAKKTNLALRVTLAAYIICLILFFCGNWLFRMLGITLDSFRIGGGALLFLSAVGLVNSNVQEVNLGEENNGDIAVVPLAIPVIVGPGTTAALLILGAEVSTFFDYLIACLSLTTAMAGLGAILLSATRLEQILRRRGIVILSKITGLVLAALAAQIIFTGIRAMLFGTPK